MTTLPPFLKKDDTIGIVCPAGYMPLENAVACIDVLKQWGYRVRVGKTLGNQFHYFSGTDDERLSDLQEMLDDPEVRAVLCARGGYGMSRIIDRIDFKKFRRHPKWLIGFSDITVLHAHVYEKYGISSLHSPMAAAFNDGGATGPFVQSLRKALLGTAGAYSCSAHELNKNGKAEGKLVGGNLSIVAHLCGTRASFNTKNCILFLEDVGEYLYNVDRMLLQLKRNGLFDNVAGVIIGGFTEMKDTAIPFGSDVYTIISEQLKEYDFPVCFGFPVSHDTNNCALKIGVKHLLTVGKGKTTLKELRKY